jgi:hypothetical protein
MIRRAAIIVIIFTVAAGICGSQTANWIKFSPPDGSCSILMPQTPEAHTTSKDTPVGKVVTNMWFADVSTGFYLLGYSDYPVDIDVQTELEKSRDNFLKAVGAKLVSESDYTLKGYPGREFTGVALDNEYTYKSRLLVVGRRDYQTVVREETPSFSVERANRFLQSFDLTQNAK